MMEKAPEKSKWENYYIQQSVLVERLEKENKDLRDLLGTQIRSNDVTGGKMEAQDTLMQDQFNDSNGQVQQLSQRIVELVTKCIENGIDPD